MKSRILLLIGALLIITPQLNGCVGTMVQRVNNVVDNMTGANDANNQSFMARSGRVSRQQSELGMSLLPSQTPEVVTPVPAAAPVVAPAPVTKTATTPAPKAKIAAKKPTTVPTSSVQPVAATPADQRAAKPAKVAPKKPPVEDKKPG